MKQADIIAADLQKQGIDVTSDKEIIALISYLQRLGTDIKNIDPKTKITK
jgi:cytochrome c oxidase cbb3-type subunit I/II